MANDVADKLGRASEVEEECGGGGAQGVECFGLEAASFAGAAGVFLRGRDDLMFLEEFVEFYAEFG